MNYGPTDHRQTPPVVLVISANDPSGGAGQGADIQAITAMSCHPAPVITSLTVQDTSNAIEVLPIPGDFVIRQATAIIEDLPVAAVKIGLLASEETGRAVARLLDQLPGIRQLLSLTDKTIGAKGKYRFTATGPRFRFAVGGYRWC
jgi:hydroxymethylpyrimidine/phosphomethylpyrimidine kinase